MNYDAYDQFLRAKAAVAPRTGVQVRRAEISAILKQHHSGPGQWAVDGAQLPMYRLGTRFLHLTEARRCYVDAFHLDTLRPASRSIFRSALPSSITMSSTIERKAVVEPSSSRSPRAILAAVSP